MERIVPYAKFAGTKKQMELIQKIYEMEQTKKDPTWSMRVHAWLRQTLDLPDQVFLIAEEKQTDEICLLLFDITPGEGTYWVKTTQDGCPYIERGE